MDVCEAKSAAYPQEKCPYRVKVLEWDAEQKKAWLDSLTALIIDMYMDAEGLQPELPLFETHR